MGEVKTGIDEVLDVHHMVVSNLVKNKSLMNRVSERALTGMIHRNTIKIRRKIAAQPPGLILKGAP